MSDHAVFIAHAESDRDFALTIAAELRRDGHSTWTYEQDGVGGVSYLEQVHTAIQHADAVVLLLSSESLKSHHVLREAETAYEHQKVIIPVRIGIEHAMVQANAILRMTSGTAVSISADDGSARDVAMRIADGLRYIEQRGSAQGVTAVVTSIAADDHGTETVSKALPPRGLAGPQRVAAALLTAFATYLRDLFGLVTGPKRFAAAMLAGPDRLERGARFLAISVAINFLMKLPFSQDPLVWQILRTAVFSLVLWGAVGIEIWVACRAAGGTGSIERTLAVGFHYFGVLELLLALTGLMFVGTLVTLDSSIYLALKQALQDGDYSRFFTDPTLGERTAVRAALGFAFTGFVAAFAWIVAGWGAFRAVHGLTRARSLAAITVAAVLWIPLWFVTLLMAAALALPQSRPS